MEVLEMMADSNILLYSARVVRRLSRGLAGLGHKFMLACFQTDEYSVY